MDSAFTIPGTSIKFGLDPVIGSIPVIGDLSTFLVSLMLFLNMARHGASRKVVVLMAINIVVDFAVGSIPFLGWIFDFAFRANDKNVRLLKEHYLEGKHQGSGAGIIFIMIAVLLVFLGLLIFGIYKLVVFLLGYFTNSGNSGVPNNWQSGVPF